jgi:hypothetical protein
MVVPTSDGMFESFTHRHWWHVMSASLLLGMVTYAPVQLVHPSYETIAGNNPHMHIVYGI